MSVFKSQAVYSNRITHNNSILSASATASATSTISQEHAYDIAFKIAKKDVEDNINKQMLDSKYNNNNNTKVIKKVTYYDRQPPKRRGCGCGKK